MDQMKKKEVLRKSIRKYAAAVPVVLAVVEDCLVLFAVKWRVMNA